MGFFISSSVIPRAFKQGRGEAPAAYRSLLHHFSYVRSPFMGLFLYLSLCPADARCNLIAHFSGTHLFAAFSHNIACAVSVLQYLADLPPPLHQPPDPGQRNTAASLRQKYRRNGVCKILSRNIRRGAVAWLIKAEAGFI